jgi:Holliday junction DNA helicase RuvA
MIGSLSGNIELLLNPYVLVDVSGVGYKVLVSEKIYSNLKLGEKIKFFVYTHVREDEISLFGFLNAEELKLFENLISVSGVGPKTALNIFSFGSKSEIEGAIIRGDVSFFTSVPRLGTKNAQKIIIELKNKMGGLGELDLSGKDFTQNKEVIEALKTFGFSVSETQKALREIKETNITTEDKIRFVLKYLGKK